MNEYQLGFLTIHFVISRFKTEIMKKIKMLKKLIERINDHKDRPSDAFMNGYNRGIDTAISVIEEKIKSIEEAED